MISLKAQRFYEVDDAVWVIGEWQGEPGHIIDVGRIVEIKENEFIVHGRNGVIVADELVPFETPKMTIQVMHDLIRDWGLKWGGDFNTYFYMRLSDIIGLSFFVINSID